MKPYANQIPRRFFIFLIEKLYESDNVSLAEFEQARGTGMKCSVSFPALRGTSFEGVVTEVPYAASDAPTYPATISIQSKNEQLRPGMAAEVLFNFGETGESLYLPSDGVGEDSDGNFVFVLEKSGEDTATARKRKIVVGPLTEKGFTLVEGLEEGDYIATSGLQILLDGMEVKLLKEMQENK